MCPTPAKEAAMTPLRFLIPFIALLTAYPLCAAPLELSLQSRDAQGRIITTPMCICCTTLIRPLGRRGGRA